MSLKLSSFENLNDLNEKEVNLYGVDFLKSAEVEEFILGRCRLLSFSRNFPNSKSVELGYRKPRMWAQYGDNHAGACIAINESKFVKENKEILSSCFNKIRNVKYVNWAYSDLNNSLVELPAHEFVVKYFNKLFFEKYKDWRHEDERRLFLIGEVDFLSINNCVEFVVLGSKFSSENEICRVLEDSISRAGKQILIPHDFRKASNSGGGINSIDWAHRILEEVEKRKMNSISYLKYLNSNGY
ncbi:DUF2971 domain-containing protein [Algoriphagus jejuensis]